MRSMPQAAQMPFLYASVPPSRRKFIAANIDDIHGTLFCGLGGSLDVFAGVSRRAPDIFIKLGLEWFYRLLKQPSRIGRMMKLPKFLLVVICERLFGKKG
ncbi:MAG: WecB/TagA/CpsF family glycosyltransferase [Butyricicoccaceae bacterium]